MARPYFLHEVKHNATSGAWEKGIVVKDSKPTARENYEDALQGYHAYLGAYAYGVDPKIDYVAVYIFDESGTRQNWEIWDGRRSGGDEGGGDEEGEA